MCEWWEMVCDWGGLCVRGPRGSRGVDVIYARCKHVHEQVQHHHTSASVTPTPIHQSPPHVHLFVDQHPLGDQVQDNHLLHGIQGCEYLVNGDQICFVCNGWQWLVLHVWCSIACVNTRVAHTQRINMLSPVSPPTPNPPTPQYRTSMHGARSSKIALCIIYTQRSSTHICALQVSKGALGCGTVVKFTKSIAFGLAGVPIQHDPVGWA